MNLAKTLATSVVTHRNLVGAKTLWQNQILYYFTELAVRFNDDGIHYMDQINARPIML